MGTKLLLVLLMCIYAANYSVDAKAARAEDPIPTTYKDAIITALQQWDSLSGIAKAIEPLPLNLLGTAANAGTIDFQHLFQFATAAKTYLLSNYATCSGLNNVIGNTFVPTQPASAFSFGCSYDSNQALLFTMAINAKFSSSPSVNLPTSLDPSVASALALTFDPATANAPLSTVFTFNASVAIAIEKNSSNIFVPARISFGTVSVLLTASGSIDSNINWKGVSATAKVALNASAQLDVVIPYLNVNRTVSVYDLKSRLSQVQIIPSGQAALKASVSTKLSGGVLEGLPLPNVQLIVTDPNIFDKQLPVTSVDYDITSMKAALAGVLSQLKSVDINFNILGKEIDIEGFQLGELLGGVGNLLDFSSISNNYFGGMRRRSGTPSIGGLVSYIQSNLQNIGQPLNYKGPFFATGGYFPQHKALELNFVLTAGADGGTNTFNLSSSLSSIFDSISHLGSDIGLSGFTKAVGLNLTGACSIVDTSFTIDVTVGIPTEAVTPSGSSPFAMYIRINDIHARTKIVVSKLSSNLKFGDASIGIDNAFIELTAGFYLNTAATFSNNITLAQIKAQGASGFTSWLGQLPFVPFGTLDASLPMKVNVSVGADLSINAIAALHDYDLFDGDAPTPDLDIDVSALRTEVKNVIARLHTDLGKSLDSIVAPLDIGPTAGLLSPVNSVFQSIDGAVDDFFDTFPNFTRAGLSPCDAPNITSLLLLLQSRFPNVNFGNISTFTPTAWLPQIQVLIGHAPDLASADHNFVWPDSMRAVDFYLPSIEFNKQLQQQLAKRFPTVDFSNFDPSKFLPYIRAFYGLAPPPSSNSKRADSSPDSSSGSSNSGGLGDITKNFGSKPSAATLATYLLSRIPGYSRNLTLGPLVITGVYDKNTSHLFIDFNTSVSRAGKPLEILDSVVNTFKNLFNMIPNDKSGVSTVVNTTGMQNVTFLSNVLDHMFVSVHADICVRVGVNVSQFVSNLTLPTFNTSIISITKFDAGIKFGLENYATNLALGVVDVGVAGANITVDWGFSLPTVNTSLRLIENGSFSLAPLKNNMTFTGKLDSIIPVSLGTTDPTLKPYLGLTVDFIFTDNDLRDGNLPDFSVDFPITGALKNGLYWALGKGDHIGDIVSGYKYLNQSIPVVGKSLNQLVKSKNSLLKDGVGDLLKFNATFDDYVTNPSKYNSTKPTIKGLAVVLKDRVEKLIDGFTATNSTSSSSNPNTKSSKRAGMSKAYGPVVFTTKYDQASKTVMFRVQIDVTRKYNYEPPLEDLIDNSLVKFNINADLGLDLEFHFLFTIVLDLKDITGSSSVSLDRLEITAKAGDEVLTADAQIGVILAKVVGGHAVLDMGLNAHYKYNASSGNGDASAIAKIDIRVPFQAEVAGIKLHTLGNGTPAVLVQSSNIFTGGLNVTTINMDHFYDFSTFGPQELMAILQSLSTYLGQYRQSSAFALSIPFTDHNLGDLYDFTDAFEKQLLQKMTIPTPVALRSTLSLNVTGESLNNADLITFVDCGSLTLTIDNITATISVTVPLAGDATISTVVNQLTASINAQGLGSVVKVNLTSDNEIAFVTADSIHADQITVSLANKTAKVLGFTDQQSTAVARVPAFDDWEHFLGVLFEMIPGIPRNLINATYHPTERVMLFTLSFGYAFDPIIPALNFKEDFAPIGSISGSANLTFDVTFAVNASFGVSFGKARGQSLSISGFFDATTAGPIGEYSLASDAHFTLNYNNKSKYITVFSGSNFTRQMQLALDSQLNSEFSITVLPDMNGYQLTSTSKVNVSKLELIVDDTSSQLLGLESQNSSGSGYDIVFGGIHLAGGVDLTLINGGLETVFGFIGVELNNVHGRLAGNLTLDFLKPAKIGTLPLVYLSDLQKGLETSPFDLIDAEFSLDAQLHIPEVLIELKYFDTQSATIDIAMKPYTVELKPGMDLIAPSFNTTTNLTDLDILRNLDFDNIFIMLHKILDYLTGDVGQSARYIADYDYHDTHSMLRAYNDLPIHKRGSTAPGPLANAILNTDIPFTGRTVGSLVDVLKDITGALSAINDNQQGSLRKLEIQLEQALGLHDDNTTNCTRSCMIEFNLRNNSDGTFSIEAVVNFGGSIHEDFSLEVDIANLGHIANVSLPSKVTTLIDITGGLNLQFTGGFTSSFTIGMDLSLSKLAIPRFYIRGNSGVCVSTGVRASNIHFTANLGPIALDVDNGSLAIDGDGNVNTNDSAFMCLSPANSTKKYYLDDLSEILDDTKFTINGSAKFVLESVDLTGPDSDALVITVPSLDRLIRATINGNFTPGIVNFTLGELKPLDIFNIFDDVFGPPEDLGPLAMLLRNPTSLVDGLDQALGKMETGLTGTAGILSIVRVPVVGNSVSKGLSASDAFFHKFRVNTIAELRNALAEAHLNESVSQFIRDTLYTVFASDLHILKDINGDGKVNSSDIAINFYTQDRKLQKALNKTSDAIEWVFTVGELYTPNFNIGFDIGDDNLPLSLNVTGGIDLDIQWSLQLGIGFSLVNGFYLLQPKSGHLLHIEASASANQVTAEGKLLLLEMTAVTNAPTFSNITFDVDISDPTPDGMLTIPDLGKVIARPADNFPCKFQVSAGLSLFLTLGIAGVEGLPEITARFNHTWAYTTDSRTKRSPNDFTLHDVSLNVGPTVNKLIYPAVKKVKDKALHPIQPVIDALNQNVPVIDTLTNRKVKLYELPKYVMQALGGKAGKYVGVTEFFTAVTAVDELINLVSSNTNNLDIVHFDDIVLFSSKTRSRSAWVDKIHAKYVWLASDPNFGNVPLSSRSLVARDSGFLTTLNKKLNSGPFRCQLFNASAGKTMIMNYLQGTPVALFGFVTPKMEIGFSFNFKIPIPAFPVAKILFTGGLDVSLQLQVGYDTSGIMKSSGISNKEEKLLAILDGFYISNHQKWTGEGPYVPMAKLSGSIGVGVSLDAFIIKVSASGKFTFALAVGLNDLNNDGRVHLSEMYAIVSMNADEQDNAISKLFVLDIELGVSVKAEVKVFALFGYETVWSKTWKFTIYTAHIAPDPYPNLGTLDNSGTLSLAARHGYAAVTHLDGAGGQESVEVIYGAPTTGKDNFRPKRDYNKITKLVAHLPAPDRTSFNTLLISGVRSPMELTAATPNDLLILDFSNTTTSLTGTITADTITGFGVTGQIKYSGFGRLEVLLGSGDDTVTITGTSAATSVAGGSGSDTYLIHTDLNKKLATFTKSLYISEFAFGTGSDALLLTVTAETQGLIGSLTEDTITGLGQAMGAIITHLNLEEINIQLGSGDDRFTIANIGEKQLVHVSPNGGNDILNVGAGFLSNIITSVPFEGGDGNDTLIIDNSQSNINNYANFSALRVECTDLRKALTHDGFEVVQLLLGFGEDTIKVTDTAVGVVSTIDGGGARDKISIVTFSGLTNIHGGAGDDDITINPEPSLGALSVFGDDGYDLINILRIDRPIYVNGGDKQDTIIVSPLRTALTNPISVPLVLDGGEDGDSFTINFYGTGSANYTIVDPSITGIDQVTVSGTAQDDLFLYRPGYVALKHPNNETEWVFIGEGVHGNLVTLGNEGDDSFYLDDTVQSMVIYGGAGDDSFKIGQLYNGPRDSSANLTTDQGFTTVRTSIGYLSNGCSFGVTAYGGTGDDNFVVLRNLGEVFLYGEDDDDTFVIKAFALADQTGNLTVDPALRHTNVSGGGGFNAIKYTHNALVYVNGGSGYDTLEIIGTEFGDTYVVTADGVYGAGRYVRFSELESLSINGDAGADEFYVYSTSRTVETHIAGGLGSDSMIVAPHNITVAAYADDGKGYSAIFENNVDQTLTTEISYRTLVIPGVSASVVDRDTPSLFIKETDRSVSFLTENDGLQAKLGSKGLEYILYLSQYPSNMTAKEIITVTISQSENRLIITPNVIYFNKVNSTFPVIVTAKVNPQQNYVRNEKWNQEIQIFHSISAPLGNIYHEVAGRTLIVNVIDNNDTFAHFFVYKPDGPMIVVEDDTPIWVGTPRSPYWTNSYYVGMAGLQAPHYQPYAYFTVSIETDITQLACYPSTFTFNGYSNPMATVSCFAVDDSLKEGQHTAIIRHRVTKCELIDPYGINIFIGNPTCVNATNIIIPDMVVVIGDNDVPGAIVVESGGYTHFAEFAETWDTYTIALTKRPDFGNVVINAVSVPTPTEYMLKPAVRAGPQLTRLTFTAANWNQPQTVNVWSNLTYNGIQGNGLKVFAPIPGSLDGINGPLSFDGGNSHSTNLVYSDPVMIPFETNPRTFESNVSQTLFDIEDEQIDTVTIINSNNNLANDNVYISTEAYKSTLLGGLNSTVYVGNLAVPMQISFQNVETYNFFGNLQGDNIAVEIGASNKIVHIDSGAGDDVVTINYINSVTTVSTGIGADSIKVYDTKKLNGLLFTDGGNDADRDVFYIKPTPNSGPATATISRTAVTDLFIPHKDSRTALPIYTLSTFTSHNVFSIKMNNTLPGSSGSFIYYYVFDAAFQATNIQLALFRNMTCGRKGISMCPRGVDVTKVGDTFLVIFQGPYAHRDPGIYSKSELGVSSNPEILRGQPQDLLKPNNQISYYNFETLNVTLDNDSDVVNILGAAHEVVVYLNGGDNRVYISSDANYNTSVPRSNFPLNAGTLTYIMNDVSVIGGNGSNLLQVSDKNRRTWQANKPECYIGATYSNSSQYPVVGYITNQRSAPYLFDNSGAIHWTGAFDEISISLGDYGNHIDYNYSYAWPSRTNGSTFTTLFTGSGVDYITITTNDNPKTLLAVASGAGNDKIDARPSNASVIAIGGPGSDIIFGGSKLDYLFGDAGYYASLGSPQTLFNGQIYIHNGLAQNLSVATYIDGFSTTADAGNDTIYGGPGNDIIFGGEQFDSLYGETGDNIIFGDLGYLMIADRKVIPYNVELYAAPVKYGAQDIIYGSNGTDIIIGGGGNDTIYGSIGNDVILGDFGRISLQLLNAATGSYATLSARGEAPSTWDGADYIDAGDGNDVVIGCQGPDNVIGGKGSDFIIGDLGFVSFNATSLKRILFANTSVDNSINNSDVIDGGDDDDIIFGGSGSDDIKGGNGSDIIYGDQGYFDARLPVEKPTSSYTAKIDAGGAQDTIDGGDGDDTILGQTGADTIIGGAGNDDIIGGFDVEFNLDTGDRLSGNEGNDYILGDNGYIERVPIGIINNCEPWCKAAWKKHDTYPNELFSAEETFPLRGPVALLHHVDSMGDKDFIYGGAGDDVLHGQTGDDQLYGDDGDDELFGEIGSDLLMGGSGSDILIGDSASIVKKVQNSTATIDHLGFWFDEDNGDMHIQKNVVLEDVVQITKIIPLSASTPSTNNSLAQDVFSSDFVIMAGEYTTQGVRYIDLDSGNWNTYAILVKVIVDAYSADYLAGEEGLDYCIGQNGDDTFDESSEYGKDLMIGDFASISVNYGQWDAVGNFFYDASFPLIYNAIRVVNSPLVQTNPSLGSLTQIPFTVYPRELASFRSVDHIIPTIDTNASIAIFKDLGVAPIKLPTSTSTDIRPIFAFVPDVTHTSVLPGNDMFYKGGPGADVIVGDNVNIANHIVFDHPYINESMAQASNAVASFQHRASLLSVDYYKVANFNISTQIGNDFFDIGSTYGEIIVGDNFNGYIVQGDASFTSTYIDVTKRMYNFYRDIEMLAVGLDFLLYQAHTDVIADIADSKPFSYAVSIGNDNIWSGDGGDVLVGDSAMWIASYVSNTTFLINKTAEVNYGQSVQEISNQRVIANFHLTDYINTLFNSALLSSPVIVPRTVTLPVETLMLGNDEIHGGSGNDSVIGDNAVFIKLYGSTRTPIAPVMLNTTSQAIYKNTFTRVETDPAGRPNPQFAGLNISWAPYYHQNRRAPIPTDMHVDKIVGEANDMVVASDVTLQRSWINWLNYTAHQDPLSLVFTTTQFATVAAAECDTVCYSSNITGEARAKLEDMVIGNALEWTNLWYLANTPLYTAPYSNPTFNNNHKRKDHL